MLRFAWLWPSPSSASVARRTSASIARRLSLGGSGLRERISMAREIRWLARDGRRDHYRCRPVHVSTLDDASAFVTLDGSTIRELAGPVSIPTANQSLAEATVPVGGATEEHYHLLSEELYFLQSGSGRLRV